MAKIKYRVGGKIGQMYSPRSPLFAFLVNIDTALTCNQLTRIFSLNSSSSQHSNKIEPFRILQVENLLSLRGEKNFLWIRFRNISVFERSIDKTSIVEHSYEMKTLCDTIKFLSVFRQDTLSKNSFESYLKRKSLCNSNCKCVDQSF